jgi:hypothetical protein
VVPHWFQCGSGSRFLPKCGSGSRRAKSMWIHLDHGSGSTTFREVQCQENVSTYFPHGWCSRHPWNSQWPAPSPEAARHPHSPQSFAASSSWNKNIRISYNVQYSASTLRYVSDIRKKYHKVRSAPQSSDEKQWQKAGMNSEQNNERRWTEQWKLR